jgi:1,4-alpha-glucan branching enzyme
MRKHYLFTFLPLLFFCLFTLSPLQVQAGDFVDDINTAATKNEAGHQVIYEMNVGSFTQAGTFAAAQQKLGELKALGIDIVWLMPVYPRGGGINSPYAPINFQQTNPTYGTIADLRAFVTAAHALNMEVWLDWVPNHTATNADWVTTHPEYYKKNGNNFVHPNNYNDVYQLNYGNADLQRAMNDCLKFWIDQADIDGYRFELRKQIGVVADKYTDHEIAMLLANDTDVLHLYIEKVEVEE